MALAEDIKGDVVIRGSLSVLGDTIDIPAGSLTNTELASDADIDSSKMAQRSLASFPLRMVDFRQHNDVTQGLPTTAATPNLGVDGHDAFSTQTPYLTTGDIQGTNPGVMYARIQWPVPMEYDVQEDVKVRIRARINGSNVAVVNNSLDVECFESNDQTGVSSIDLIGTLFQTLTTSWADYDFLISSTSVLAGEMLDIRITVNLDDTGGLDACIGEIGRVEILMDTRG